MNFKFIISALGPTIGEQAAIQGLTSTGMSIDKVDDMSHQLTKAHIWGLLTDSEINKARHRLLKRAKFCRVEAKQ